MLYAEILEPHFVLAVPCAAVQLKKTICGDCKTELQELFQIAGSMV